MGARIIGGPAEAATSQEVVALDRIPVDQVAEGRTITEMGTPEGLPLEAQEVPEMEEAQEVRGEEVAP